MKNTNTYNPEILILFMTPNSLEYDNLNNPDKMIYHKSQAAIVKSRSLGPTGEQIRMHLEGIPGSGRSITPVSLARRDLGLCKKF